MQSHTIYGEVILVPNCNPVGTNIKAGEYTLGRFDPVNGTNWNRGYYYDEEAVLAFAETVTEEQTLQSIKTDFHALIKHNIKTKLEQPWGLGLAQQLNLTLQHIAADADIVLDLHNGPVSTRHAYIPEYAKQAAKQFSIPHCIFIPNKFAGALDEATFCPWWTLQDALSAKFNKAYDFGVQAFTLEMGSQEVINMIPMLHFPSASVLSGTQLYKCFTEYFTI